MSDSHCTKCVRQAVERLSEEDDTTGPSMCLYTKRFYKYVLASPIPPQYLEIYVEDPSGVDKVIVSYTKGTDSWTNTTMTPQEGEENWFEVTLDISAVRNTTTTTGCTEGCDIVFQVKYWANDSLGNIAMTENLLYRFRQSWIASDGSSVILEEKADYWYVVGTEGHTITWDIIDGGPQSYSLTIDGHLIESWHWTGPVEIDLDGLPIGTYTVRLYASYGVASDWQTFVVHIVENSSQIGVVTDSSSEPTRSEGINPTVLIAVCIGALIFLSIAGLLICRKTRGSA